MMSSILVVMKNNRMTIAITIAQAKEKDILDLIQRLFPGKFLVVVDDEIL